MKKPATSSKVGVVVRCDQIGGATYRIATACLGKPIRTRHYFRRYFLKFWAPRLIERRQVVQLKRGDLQFILGLGPSDVFIIPAAYSEVLAEVQLCKEMDFITPNAVVATPKRLAEVLTKVVLHNPIYIVDKPIAPIVRRLFAAKIRVEVATTPFIYRGAFVVGRIVEPLSRDVFGRFALAHLKSSFSEVLPAE